MKFTKHQNAGFAISRIDSEGIWVDGAAYAEGLALYGESLISPVQLASLEELALADIREILPELPEILVLGCGAQSRFPGTSLLQEAASAGIGLEVMTDDAACRTYNVLQHEARSVALIILG